MIISARVVGVVYAFIFSLAGGSFAAYAVVHRLVALHVQEAGYVQLMEINLPYELRMDGETTNCFAQQENAAGIMDPSNCFGHPATPGKHCAEKWCQKFCASYPNYCSPRRVGNAPRLGLDPRVGRPAR